MGKGVDDDKVVLLLDFWTFSASKTTHIYLKVMICTLFTFDEEFKQLLSDSFPVCEVFNGLDIHVKLLEVV